MSDKHLYIAYCLYPTDIDYGRYMVVALSSTKLLDLNNKGQLRWVEEECKKYAPIGFKKVLLMEVMNEQGIR